MRIEHESSKWARVSDTTKGGAKVSRGLDKEPPDQVIVKKIKGRTRHAMKIQMNVVAINGLRQGVAFLFFFIFFWEVLSLWNF
jgi:hypothetical protein